MDAVAADRVLSGNGGATLVLIWGGALVSMVQLAILPSLTQIAAHYGADGSGVLDGAAIAQLVATIAAPTMVVGGLLTGWLADRISKRLVFLISALVYALSGVAGAFAPDIWTLLASRALLGLASAGLATVSTVLMGDYYAREKRDRLIGWSAFLGGGGALVSLLAAGGLAELDWRAPFGLYLVGLVIFLIALPTIKEPERAATVTAAVAGGSVRNATGLFALTILISIVMYMGSVQGPFLFASRGIVSPSTQALIADGITIASMVSSYLFGILRPKLGFAGILVLLWVALGVGVVGMGVTDNLAMLIFFGVVSGFGSGFMAPLTQSSILNVVPAAAHSRAMGISFACIFIGLFIQPIILAPVRAALGIQTSFVWVGVAALIAAALTVIWRMSAGVTKGQPGVGNV